MVLADEILFLISNISLNYAVLPPPSTVPKGGIEEGETSGQAAVRESYEEGVLIVHVSF
jgi:ADP-ribose pyrophosphatase YjhB (NUDIX family)